MGVTNERDTSKMDPEVEIPMLELQTGSRSHQETQKAKQYLATIAGKIFLTVFVGLVCSHF